MAELYRVEECHGADAIRCSIGRVMCSFTSDTYHEGTMVECIDGKIKVPRSQPDLYLYSKRERRYMKQATAIVYMLVFAREHHDQPEYHKA